MAGLERENPLRRSLRLRENPKNPIIIEEVDLTLDSVCQSVHTSKPGETLETQNASSISDPVQCLPSVGVESCANTLSVAPPEPQYTETNGVASPFAATFSDVTYGCRSPPPVTDAATALQPTPLPPSIQDPTAANPEDAFLQPVSVTSMATGISSAYSSAKSAEISDTNTDSLLQEFETDGVIQADISATSEHLGNEENEAQDSDDHILSTTVDDDTAQNQNLQAPNWNWKQHRCQICSKVLRTSVSLKQHMNLHIKEKSYPWSCSYCSRKFKFLTTLSRHELILHPDKLPSEVSNQVFKCEWCPKTCPDKSTLMAHTRIHTGEKPFKCGFCPKTFSMDWNKRSHEKRMHGGLSDPKTGMEKLRCQICERLCKSKHFFDIHMKIHAGEKPFQCPYCPATFTSQLNTRWHGYRIHPEKYGGIDAVHKYKCRWCPEQHYTSQNLRKHEARHTGARPYSCETCNKSFVSQSYLRQHQKLISHKYQLLLQEETQHNQESNTSELVEDEAPSVQLST